MTDHVLPSLDRDRRAMSPGSIASVGDGDFSQELKVSKLFVVVIDIMMAWGGYKPSIYGIMWWVMVARGPTPYTLLSAHDLPGE